MKHCLVLSMALILTIPVFSQISPNGNRAAVVPNIRARLIELAIQNPDLEIADYRIKIAKYNLKSAKGWWLKNISLSFNANELTIKRITGDKPADGQYYPYYPFYNVGINIPIGGIFTQPAKVKAARVEVTIAKAQRNNTYRAIKAEVLSAYENYLASRRLLTVQVQIAESSYNEYLQAKQKFRTGDISIIEYNAASEAYHKQLKNKINAQHNLNLNEIKLETLIGVPLRTVLATQQPQNTLTNQLGQ